MEESAGTEPRRVLIVEVLGGGHRLVYMRLLAESALREGHRVVLCLPGTVIGSVNFDQHLGKLADAVEIEQAPDGELRAAWLEDLARRLGADHVVVPHGDAFTSRELSRRRWRGPSIATLIMRDPHGEQGGAGRALRNLAKRCAIAIASRQRNVHVVWLAQYGDPAARGRTVALDPFILDASREVTWSEGARLRERLNMSPDVAWIGMVGALSKRKNVGLVAETLATLKDVDGKPLGLFLYGSLDADLAFSERALREQLPAGLPVVISAGVKTNQQINEAVAACDCVITAYSIHYPNSTLVKALALGVRCVVAGSHFMRVRAGRLSGVTTADLTIESIGAGVATALRAPAPEPRRDFGTDAFVSPLLG